MSDRLTRLNELLRREIGMALFRVLKEDDVDHSAITITHVMASRNLRNARVLVSVRDEGAPERRVMSLLMRHRREIQDLLNRNLVMKYTPRLHFELDRSIHDGDHILEVLSELGGDDGFLEPEEPGSDMPPTEEGAPGSV